MLFLTVLALTCSVAFAAPQVDVGQLNKLVDDAIVEIAKVEALTFDAVGITGLSSLKRTTCKFLDDTQYLCLAVADNAILTTPEGETYKVIIEVPIITVLNENKIVKFIVGEVDVKVNDENAYEDGLFKHFWKKVKHTVSKAAHLAGHIVAHTTKQVLKEKTRQVVGKVIGVVITKVGK